MLGNKYRFSSGPPVSTPGYIAPSLYKEDYWFSLLRTSSQIRIPLSEL
jgi:hypothetical protein